MIAKVETKNRENKWWIYKVLNKEEIKELIDFILDMEVGEIRIEFSNEDKN